MILMVMIMLQVFRVPSDLFSGNPMETNMDTPLVSLPEQARRIETVMMMMKRRTMMMMVMMIMMIGKLRALRGNVRDSVDIFALTFVSKCNENPTSGRSLQSVLVFGIATKKVDFQVSWHPTADLVLASSSG